MKKIVFVEDSRSFRALVRKEIERFLKKHQVAAEITDLASESEAIEYFNNPSHAIADFVLVDLALIWSAAPDQGPEPEWVIQAGIHDAGYRVIKVIQAQERWKACKIVIYSSRGVDEVPKKLKEYELEEVEAIPKEDKAEPLLIRIQELFGLSKHQT